MSVFSLIPPPSAGSVNPNFDPKIIAQISEVSSVSQSNSSIPVNTSLPVPSIATPSSEATNAAQTGGNQ